ncbi:MAG TPA: cytochrome c [Gaiellaceae bacterium]|jgi:cytochrome c2|nr:cytochrome c [Gaiellaceae bacterium]
MRLVLLAAAAALLAGCAGGHSTARGRGVFERSCTSCHTLTGHDTSARGGDLRAARLTAADVASFARIMPVRPPLSSADARAVGRYVVSR